MLFAEVVACSSAVAATSARKGKIELLSQCLEAAAIHELPAIVAWLSGAPRQRRTGVGWASVRERIPEALTSTLSVSQVDSVLQRVADDSGPGSSGRRTAELGSLMAAATAAEQSFLRDLLARGVRQGAAEPVLTQALAVTFGVAGDRVRRALTFGGDLGAVAVALRRSGVGGLQEFRLRIGVPVQPMLAQSAADLDAALERLPHAAIDIKLDGVRVQVHRDGDDIAVFTRSLDDITARSHDVVRAVRALDARQLILDGEIIALDDSRRPMPFQVTASQAARHSSEADADRLPLTLTGFDLLHARGEDLIDEPLSARHELLPRLAPELIVPRLLPDQDQDDHRTAARAFSQSALAKGHEGVVVKSWDAPYALGRRDPAWVKVKPHHSVDLVVLAVERGHGRRSGWLSNLHLGARDVQGRYGPRGGFVMVGKTFKGLSDAMLAHQSQALAALAVSDDGYTIRVRPEFVVEIAYDCVQTSTRYPAGIALRFARVVAHRPDLPPEDVDSIDDVASRSHTGPAQEDS